MGKRSNFERRPMDAYQTPYDGAVPLFPMLEHVRTFAEPCAGERLMVRHLESAGLTCVYQDDVQYGRDALTLRSRDLLDVDAIITNPPWTRELMHPLIAHFMRLAPTWLLFDADWAHTVQAAPFMRHCSHIVSVGRLKWIAKSKNTGKDNAAWYRFHIQHNDGPRFVGRRRKPHERNADVE